MIQINCSGSATALLSSMKPLQGALKHRTQTQIEELQASLQLNGLLQPFVLWSNPARPEEQFILDGHGRYTALIQLTATFPELTQTAWPIILVNAESLDEARKLLLEMNVKYGRITPRGLDAFLKEARTPIAVPSALVRHIPMSKRPAAIPTRSSSPATANSPSLNDAPPPGAPYPPTAIIDPEDPETLRNAGETPRYRRLKLRVLLSKADEFEEILQTLSYVEIL